MKSHLQVSLILKTLDALMGVSLANIPIDEIDWNHLILFWRYEGLMN